MDEVELTNYVVQRLGKEDDPDDIIQSTCYSKGWSWYRVRRFMLQVQTEKQQITSKKRFPLLFLLAYEKGMGCYTFQTNLIGLPITNQVL
ncbi:MAG: hypothetical protein AB1531_12080 [Chloroflexota bacterium]